MAAVLNVMHSLENSSIITCLANDESYSDIFSFQLGVLAEKEDILLVLSGSGNSRILSMQFQPQKVLECRLLEY